MAFEEGTDEMTCPSCQARHVIRWPRTPVRELATLKCVACASIMFHGKTVRDHYEVRLID